MIGRRLLGATLTAAWVMSACQSGGPPARGSADSPGTRRVTDMRGVEVAVPARITRVATISDGFVESVMTRLGVVRTLVAIGSAGLRDTWSYSFPTAVR